MPLFSVLAVLAMLLAARTYEADLQRACEPAAEEATRCNELSI
jgi:hypothetical protein